MKVDKPTKKYCTSSPTSGFSQTFHAYPFISTLRLIDMKGVGGHPIDWDFFWDHRVCYRSAKCEYLAWGCNASGNIEFSDRMQHADVVGLLPRLGSWVESVEKQNKQALADYMFSYRF